MSDKVVNIFDRPRKKKERAEDKTSFEEIMERNKRNEERLKRERNKANKSVTRSYRLKK
jgi:hypothetical protein